MYVCNVMHACLYVCNGCCFCNIQFLFKICKLYVCYFGITVIGQKACKIKIKILFLNYSGQGLRIRILIRVRIRAYGRSRTCAGQDLSVELNYEFHELNVFLKI